MKSRKDVELDAPDAAAAWKLPEPGQLRTRGPLLQLEAVSFAYPATDSNSNSNSTPVEGQPDLAGAAGNAPRPSPARRKPVLTNITLCVEQA